MNYLPKYLCDLKFIIIFIKTFVKVGRYSKKKKKMLGVFYQKYAKIYFFCIQIKTQKKPIKPLRHLNKHIIRSIKNTYFALFRNQKKKKISINTN
jgi:hypothetical protein